QPTATRSSPRILLALAVPRAQRERAAGLCPAGEATQPTATRSSPRILLALAVPRAQRERAAGLCPACEATQLTQPRRWKSATVQPAKAIATATVRRVRLRSTMWVPPCEAGVKPMPPKPVSRPEGIRIRPIRALHGRNCD